MTKEELKKEFENIFQDYCKDALNKTEKDLLTDKEFDDILHEDPDALFTDLAESLTEEQFNILIKERPDLALFFNPERMSRSQLEYCIVKEPRLFLELRKGMNLEEFREFISKK